MQSLTEFPETKTKEVGNEKSTRTPQISDCHNDFLMFCYRRLDNFDIPAGMFHPDMPLTTKFNDLSRTQIRTLRFLGTDEVIVCIPVEGGKGQKLVRLESGYVHKHDLHIRSVLIPYTLYTKIIQTDDTGRIYPQIGKKSLSRLWFKEEVVLSFKNLAQGLDNPLSYIAYLLNRPLHKKINAAVAASLVMTQGYALNLQDETVGQLSWTPAQIKLLHELRKKNSGAGHIGLLQPRPDKTTIKEIVTEFQEGRINDILLRELDLSGCTLSNMDMSYIDLSNTCLKFSQLSGVTLRSSTLRGANLQCACLARADCRNASFANADLRFTDLSHAVFDNVDLSGAKLTQVVLTGTMLKKTILKRATLDSRATEDILAAFKDKRAHKNILYLANLPEEYLSGEKRMALIHAGLILDD